VLPNYYVEVETDVLCSFFDRVVVDFDDVRLLVTGVPLIGMSLTLGLRHENLLRGQTQRWRRLDLLRVFLTAGKILGRVSHRRQAKQKLRQAAA
jgi:hypothetical protein